MFSTSYLLPPLLVLRRRFVLSRTNKECADKIFQAFVSGAEAGAVFAKRDIAKLKKFSDDNLWRLKEKH
jgi:hypothetical protein